MVDKLGVVGIILTYIGIAMTIIGVGFTVYIQGRALHNPIRSQQYGKTLMNISWIWFVAGAIFLIIALYLFILLGGFNMNINFALKIIEILLVGGTLIVIMIQLIKYIAFEKAKFQSEVYTQVITGRNKAWNEAKAAFLESDDLKNKISSVGSIENFINLRDLQDFIYNMWTINEKALIEKEIWQNVTYQIKTTWKLEKMGKLWAEMKTTGIWPQKFIDDIDKIAST